MLGYILTVVLCMLLWKLLRFGKDLKDSYSRYAAVPTMSMNHWFWGFTNQVNIGIFHCSPAEAGGHTCERFVE